MVYSAPTPKSKQPRSFKSQSLPQVESAEPQVQREEQNKAAVVAERPWGALTDNMPPPPDSGGPLHGIEGLVVQRDLALGEAHDPYEAEADQVAQQVVKQINAPPSVALDSGSDTPGIQLQAQRPTLQLDGGGEGGKVPAPIENKINQARGGGRPLSGEMQQKLSPVMGEQVVKETRVHTDAAANEICEGTNATAATTNQDVFFKRGKFNETSTEGQTLIAHELTHRQQQSGLSLQGRSGGIVQRKIINDDEAKSGLHGQYPDRNTLINYLKNHTTDENAAKLVDAYYGDEKDDITLLKLVDKAKEVPRQQNNDDDWAHFSDSEETNNNSNNNSSKSIDKVGINECKASTRDLETEGLGDCTTFVGVDCEGTAVMYHIEIEGQCYRDPQLKHSWDKEEAKIKQEYEDRKKTMLKSLNQTQPIRWQCVLGGSWDFVLGNPNVFPGAKEWQKRMVVMFGNVFPKCQYKGWGEGAYYSAANQTLESIRKKK